MSERRRLVALVTFALILAGAWRVYAVVGAKPVLGYANQFDMGRTSACVGLWPAVPGDARFEAHPQAPIGRYMRGEKRPQTCYISTELAFAATAAALAKPDESIDLRVVGAIKAITLLAVALALNALLLRAPAWAFAHALVFALVVCDPMNTLWLNTLYTEFAALLCAYAAVVLLIAIGAREPQSVPPPMGVVAAFALSLIGLGLSRQQHLLLPAIIALPVVISLWMPAHRAALALVVTVCAIALLQATTLGRHPSITAANNADVVLGAILPASRDQALSAARLGLPERCLQSVGATWYETMGETLQSSCPEAMALPRGRLAALAIIEPATFLRAGARALPQLQDWRLAYLGTVEGRDYAGADAVREVAGAAAFSVAPVVTASPWMTVVLCLTAALAVLVAAAVFCVVGAIRQRAMPLALALYALTGIAWYVIATAIFGDGYVEIARHTQLAATSLFAAVVILTAAVFAAAWPAVRGSARAPVASAIVLATFVALILVAVLVQTPMRSAIAATPMALGVVDRPQQNVVSDAEVEFSGWAVDPFGVNRVEIVAADGTVVAARYGLPYVGTRGEALALYFPSYPDVAAAGFVARLPATLLSRGAIEVRTVVVNDAGVRTEIDRRRLAVRSR